MLQEATIAGVVVVGVEVESVEMMMAIAVEVVAVRLAVMVTQMGGEGGRGKERKHGSGNSYHWNRGSGGRSSGNTCFSGQLSGNFGAKGSSSVGAFGVVYRQISSGYSGSAGSGTLICGTKSEPATLPGSNSIISN
jgi:hypothetical protein